MSSSSKKSVDSTSSLNRREFLRQTAAATAGLAAARPLASRAAGGEEVSFASDWKQVHERVWIGPDFWANPLQDWRVQKRRVECIHAAPNRNLHLLTYQLRERAGDLRMSVRLGRVNGSLLIGSQGSAGFRIGIQGPLREYRNNLVFGVGLDAGLDGSGSLFIGSGAERVAAPVELRVASVELTLTLESKDDRGLLVLAAMEPGSGRLLGQVEREGLMMRDLTGNVALVANFPEPAGAQGALSRPRNLARAGKADTFWFEDWKLAGSKLEHRPEQSFGPILFSQYTLSGGLLKLTAQMAPMGAAESSSVRLEARRKKDWEPVGDAAIHPEARTATFRIEDWPDTENVPYRLVYTQPHTDGSSRDYFWTGTIRQDPVGQRVVTVADVSCNFHAAFPNTDYVAKMAALNPDLLAFVGDQFYESSGGYGTQRAPLEPAILDYLRKWYLHGWTWRELTRDRPSLSLPDDHDVYQGNVWGVGGAAQHGTQEMGGYEMPAAWVNVVHRTQTSHHPDPYDPAPIKQGISVYYGPLTYGRISFAVLADRMFKSAPEGNVPPTGDRGDHVVDPNFDPKTADLPGLELLGERQMQFLREWAVDWRGADMKAVISQTIFAAMATTHGGNRERLRADYDANGWPQAPRNQALREMRKALAFHLAGDQHLPALIQYGVDTHRDAGVAFAGPAVNVGYPRWWEPVLAGKNRKPGAPENTGDFLDHFDNPLTVLAVANGAVKPRQRVLEQMHDKASGLGLVRFDKKTRQITVECWPFLADPSRRGTQFPGWPVTVSQWDNYGRQAEAYLPELKVRGMNNAVLHVLDQASGETIYCWRLHDRTFRPPVFAEGAYRLRIGSPETGKWREFPGVIARKDNEETLLVRFDGQDE